MDTLHSPVHQTNPKSLPLKITHSNSKLSFPDQSSMNSSIHAFKANSNVHHMKRVPFCQILNQEEQDTQQQAPRKLFKIPSKNHNGQQNPEKGILKSAKIVSTQPQKSASYETKGTQSIQLISIIEEEFESYSENIENEDFTDVKHRKRSKLVINQEAIEHLLNITCCNSVQKESKSSQKVVFCSLVGKAKTGKSFLLNQLINSFHQDSQNINDQNNSSSQSFQSTSREQTEFEEPHHLGAEANTFTVNHTLVPSTKGIWISQKSVTLPSNGHSLNLFFLDTQGLDSSDSTQQIDYKLFTLSLLLTDILCFNCIGAIDQQMLNGMSLAVEISKFIQKSQENSTSISSPHTISPPCLLWILRDFSLQLMTNDQQQITSDQYLENCLSLEPKNSHQKQLQKEPNQPRHSKSKTNNDKRKSKENIRKVIREIFQSRKCQTLVMPFDEEGQIRDEFRNGLQKCKIKLKNMIEESKCKMQKQRSRIQDFICGLKAFVEVLNGQRTSNGQGIFPNMHCLQQKLAKTKVQFELETLGRKYENMFAKYEENLEKLDAECECLESYLKKIDALKQSLEFEVMQINGYFNERISQKLNLQSSGDTNLLRSQTSTIKPEESNSPQTKIDFKKLLVNGTGPHIIEKIEKNYEDQLASVKSRKTIILGKIESKIEAITNRTNQSQYPFKFIKPNFERKSTEHSLEYSNQAQSLIAQLKQQTNDWVQIIKSISKVSELKKAFEKSIRDINSIISSKQSLANQPSLVNSETKNCLKELQVEYLRQKVSLMEESQFQNSNTSCSNTFSNTNSVFKSSCSQIKEGHSHFESVSNFNEHRQVKKYDDCSNCEKSFYIPYIIIPSFKLLKLSIIKTIAKEIHHEFNGYSIDQLGLNQQKDIEKAMEKKCKLEFIIQVSLNDKTWLIRRKLKDFVELNKIVTIMFGSQQIDWKNDKEFAVNAKLRALELNFQGLPCEERGRKVKSELEKFLNELNGLEQVRNSRIFQKFVKINKEYIDV